MSKYREESPNETSRISCVGSLPSNQLVRLVERVNSAFALYDQGHVRHALAFCLHRQFSLLMFL